MDGSRIIFDTSTLILLARLSILRTVVENWSVRIPAPIHREAVVKKTPDALLIEELVSEGILRVEAGGFAKEARRLKAEFRIAEEASALAMAKKRGVPVGTDDGQAIRAAQALGVQVIGAPAFLIRLHDARLLSTELALAKVDELGRIGRYRSDVLEWLRKKIGGEK
jgi:predicted nucleic acid-binding protein